MAVTVVPTASASQILLTWYLQNELVLDLGPTRRYRFDTDTDMPASGRFAHRSRLPTLLPVFLSCRGTTVGRSSRSSVGSTIANGMFLRTASHNKLSETRALLFGRDVAKQHVVDAATNSLLRGDANSANINLVPPKSRDLDHKRSRNYWMLELCTGLVIKR